MKQDSQPGRNISTNMDSSRYKVEFTTFYLKILVGSIQPHIMPLAARRFDVACSFINTTFA